MNEKDIHIKDSFYFEEKITNLSKELQKIKTESNNNWNLFIRAKHEIENTKKRFEKEILNLKKYSNKNLFLDLLQILDSLESFIENENNKNNKNYFGNKLLYKMLIFILNKNNVKKIIIKKYSDFDPNKHEVITIVQNESYENKIFSIFQSGYMLNDQILRYAKVSLLKKK